MSERPARKITGRTIICGRLVLETPAHLGNGDTVGVTDMPLLRDPLDGKSPLLTGASIAGALRNYLRERERGYGTQGQSNDFSERLFGRLDEVDRASVQSWLLVDDAVGKAAGIELRDGVAIVPATRTAADKQKYDIELLAAGTTFDICLEFLESDKSRELLPGLAAALEGLQTGQIGLGQRKRRGFGRCKVTEWRVRRYNLTSPPGLVAWLDDNRAGEKSGSDIYALLGIKPTVDDQREWLRVEAEFGLIGSLLIRSSSAKPGSPDRVHLTSQRAEGQKPIVSGTSLAGAVRSRAGRIANTLLGQEEGKKLIRGMFGYMDEKLEHRDTQASAAGRPLTSGSRVVTEESIVEGVVDLVQSRVKIDRFTGGAFPTALFSQQPIYATPESRLTLTITLRSPKDTEIGLLLLVLKDLWTGDLPLGGESSVGRGRLEGRCATIRLQRKGSGEPQTWQLFQEAAGLRCEPAEGFAELDRFVTEGLAKSATSVRSEGGEG